MILIILWYTVGIFTFLFFSCFFMSFEKIIKAAEKLQAVTKWNETPLTKSNV